MIDARVHACVIDGERRLFYLQVHTPDGVVAPGRSVLVRRPSSAGDGDLRDHELRHIRKALFSNSWLMARIVEPWDHGFGSIVCLELEGCDTCGEPATMFARDMKRYVGETGRSFEEYLPVAPLKRGCDEHPVQSKTIDTNEPVPR